MTMQRLAGTAVTGLLLLGGASAVNAQQGYPPQPRMRQASPEANISNSDLERFANAVQQIQRIEQKAQSKILEVVETQGLTPERFNAIAQSRQDPRLESEMNLSREEAQTFNQAASEISGIRQEAEIEKEAAVKQEGFGVQDFNAVSQTIENDQSLRKQVIQMLQN